MNMHVSPSTPVTIPALALQKQPKSDRPHLVDPIFDLIDAHRKTVVVRVAAAAAADHDCNSPDGDAEIARDNAVSSELAAAKVLTETVPTTLAGVLAVTNHVHGLFACDDVCFEDDVLATLFRSIAKATASLHLGGGLAPTALVALGSAAGANPDAEIIAAGEKFEPLLGKFVTTQLEWAKRHRAGKAEVEAKFGFDYRSDVWNKPTPNKSPAVKLLSEALKRHGERQANAAVSALDNKMTPLAEFIRNAPVETIQGLRAKTLVAIWDGLPVEADHDGSFCIYRVDEPLFRAAVAVTGLFDMAHAIEMALQRDLLT
jgi:hypothetical protein